MATRTALAMGSGANSRILQCLLQACVTPATVRTQCLHICSHNNHWLSMPALSATASACTLVTGASQGSVRSLSYFSSAHASSTSLQQSMTALQSQLQRLQALLTRSEPQERVLVPQHVLQPAASSTTTQLPRIRRTAVHNPYSPQTHQSMAQRVAAVVNGMEQSHWPLSTSSGALIRGSSFDSGYDSGYESDDDSDSDCALDRQSWSTAAAAAAAERQHMKRVAWRAIRRRQQVQLNAAPTHIM
eukprot:jgi/Chrzof1/4930/Cz15g05010.t1